MAQSKKSKKTGRPIKNKARATMWAIRRGARYWNNDTKTWCTSLRNATLLPSKNKAELDDGEFWVPIDLKER